MKKYLWIFLVCTLALESKEVIRPKRYKDYENPWTTGPLLAPSVAAVTAGHVNFEPYVYAVANTGVYNKSGKSISTPTFWNTYLNPVLQIGLTSFMDMQISPSLYYNYVQHQAKWEYGDTPITVDFQIAQPHHQESLVPYIKFSIIETFPSGKYQKLDPKKLGTDISGEGSYQTTIGLTVGELFHIYKHIFIEPRLYVTYTYPAPTRVKGLNAYGGGYKTSAKVYPGQNILVDFAFELTLSKNWVFACDFEGSWTQKARTSGRKGFLRNGMPAPLGKPSSRQFSMAPALEYNFNQHIGLISGCWFTLAGRNTSKFASSVTALNVYY